MNSFYMKICVLAFGTLLMSEIKAQNFNGIIGAFEIFGDIYVSFQNSGNNRLMSKKVEGYLSAEVTVSTLEAPVDVVYSNKHKRLYAIYRTNTKKFIAHAIHEVVNESSGDLKTAFGVIKDPETNKTMAVYLNKQNKIIAFALE